MNFSGECERCRLGYYQAVRLGACQPVTNTGVENNSTTTNKCSKDITQSLHCLSCDEPNKCSVCAKGITDITSWSCSKGVLENCLLAFSPDVCFQCESGYYVNSQNACSKNPTTLEIGFVIDCVEYAIYQEEVKCVACKNGKYTTNVWSSSEDVVNCLDNINLTLYPYLAGCASIRVTRAPGDSSIGQTPNSYRCQICESEKYLKINGNNMNFCEPAIGMFENCWLANSNGCSLCNIGSYQPQPLSKCIKIEASGQEQTGLPANHLKFSSLGCLVGILTLIIS